MTLYEISHLLGGKVIGNGNIVITTISPPDNPTDGSIVYVEKEKYIDNVLQSPANALLISSDINIPPCEKPIITVNDGKLAFIQLLSHFKEEITYSKGIHNTAIIGNNVSIGDYVTIMPYVTIMDHVIIDEDVIIYPHSFIGTKSHIKKGSVIHPHVTLEERTLIGEYNIIHTGAVIGSDGFGYHDQDGKRYKIPQIGFVETGNHVEIGSNTTIDRATIGKTFIGKETKIDNLVQIAHNVTIGEYCYIASQTGIAGSCTIGNRVTLAGQVGVADHITIEDDVIVLGQSGVTHNLKKGEVVMGFPAKPVKEARKIIASLSKLPNIVKNRWHNL